MVSHWILSDSKSFDVSKTLLSILVDLNNAVVWVVSARPLISKPSSPFTYSLVTVPIIIIMIIIIILLLFVSFSH